MSFNPPSSAEGLPDSHTRRGRCPRCGTYASFAPLGTIPVTFDEHSYTMERDGSRSRIPIERVVSLQCQHCDQCVVVVEEMWIGDAPRHLGRGGAVSHHGIHWWPLPTSVQSPDVPTEIAGALNEAATALAARCPRASAVMARRTLEAIVVDKGEPNGSLASRLSTLAQRHVLTSELADWAKEVRLIGNIGAHVDPLQQVSVDDARQLIAFLRQLVYYFYELPAELARRRAGTP